MCVLTVVGAHPGTALAEALSGRDVIIRMQMARARGSDDAATVFRLELRDRSGGVMTRTVATYRKQCDDAWRQLIHFLGPGEVAGTSLLSWSRPAGRADMWLYLPELGRVRQLNPSAQGATFLDSDFTYEDLGMFAVDDRDHRLLAAGEVDGEPAYKVQSVPRGESPYGKVVTWVSRTTFLPVEVDYYDRFGVLIRSGRFEDVRMVKGIPTPFMIEMQSVDTGHRTRLSLIEAEYQAGLECELFTKRRMRRGVRGP